MERQQEPQQDDESVDHYGQIRTRSQCRNRGIYNEEFYELYCETFIIEIRIKTSLENVNYIVVLLIFYILNELMIFYKCEDYKLYKKISIVNFVFVFLSFCVDLFNGL